MSKIFGRDRIIDQIWRTLEKRSVYMNDLRRIGKTMIIEEMERNPRAGWKAIKRDLGRCHKPSEFAALVYRDVLSELPGARKFMRKMGKLLGDASGASIGPLTLPSGQPAPWKEVLETTFSDINQALDKQNGNLVFLWDEVPFLLDNVIKNSDQERVSGEKIAMQILDVLRSLRQDYPRIKLVLTGSIGIHHILSELREEDYVNSPLNDMKPIAPGPLDRLDAIDLANRLLHERGIHESSANGAKIADLVGGVPFYIESFIDGFDFGESISADQLELRLAERLVNPDDDWDLPHYRTRLSRYFGRLESLALAILDFLARDEVFRSNGEILEALRASGLDCELEGLRPVLNLLHRDHYLIKDASGFWGYRLKIVRRWWRLDRGI